MTSDRSVRRSGTDWTHSTRPDTACCQSASVPAPAVASRDSVTADRPNRTRRHGLRSAVLSLSSSRRSSVSGSWSEGGSCSLFGTLFIGIFSILFICQLRAWGWIDWWPRPVQETICSRIGSDQCCGRRGDDSHRREPTPTIRLVAPTRDVRSYLADRNHTWFFCGVFESRDRRYALDVTFLRRDRLRFSNAFDRLGLRFQAPRRGRQHPKFNYTIALQKYKIFYYSVPR